MIPAKKRESVSVPFIAAMADFKCFKAGKQPPLLFIEQTEKQDDGGFEFIGLRIYLTG